jgi:hypothetical protein
LVKLEKQLDRIHFNPRPSHPMLQDPGEIDSGDRMRAEHWARYKREKPRRKLAMKLAREVIQSSGEMTVTKLYKTARENGFKVRTVSELAKYEKDSLARESSSLVFPYLKRFWEFCGLTRPESNWSWKWDFRPVEFKVDELGAAHYKGWIETLHARQALISEMESVKGLMAELERMEQERILGDEFDQNKSDDQQSEVGL